MEKLAKEILNEMVIEESKKIKREDFNRILFKIEEIEKSVFEIEKDIEKMENIIPFILKSTTAPKINLMKNNLLGFQRGLFDLKIKINKLKKKNNTDINKIKDNI